MRIITGAFKGRSIQPVPGNETRPTSDKVKEAVFHVLGPFFNGGITLDLFAGSGSLGIEALSRGMDNVIFIDQSPTAIKTIRTNLKRLQIEKNVSVYRNDAFRALHILAKKQAAFDLILIDPPYESSDYSKLLHTILQNKLAKERCLIYLEHVPDKAFIYDESILLPIFTRRFSETIAVTILRYENVE